MTTIKFTTNDMKEINEDIITQFKLCKDKLLTEFKRQIEGDNSGEVESSLKHISSNNESNTINFIIDFLYEVTGYNISIRLNTEVPIFKYFYESSSLSSYTMNKFEEITDEILNIFTEYVENTDELYTYKLDDFKLSDNTFFEYNYDFKIIYTSKMF